MDISIRSATLDDFPEILRVDGAAFGLTYEPVDLDDILTIVDPDRFLVATDADAIVGISGDFPFAMTLPGRTQLDVRGVTWVSVSPTHRRRGILSDLMHHQLRGFADAGAPAAILTASESGIYGRFGYGPASQIRKVSIDRRRARLRRPVDSSSVVLATAAQARAAIPEIHERWRQQVPGGLRRAGAWWDLVELDRPHLRHGMSNLFYLLHADGYVAYRVREDWNDWNPRHVCVISEYAAVTPEAHAALWQVLLGLDLFGAIETDRLPADDPVPLLLGEPRLVRTTMLSDGVWVRPLDVEGLLGARRYAIEVDVVVEVRDELLGDGRYRLRGGPDGAVCERTDRSPDLICDVAVLGSLSLGGQRLQAFVDAGLVGAPDAATVRRLDRALLADRAPYHGTPF